MLTSSHGYSFTSASSIVVAGEPWVEPEVLVIDFPVSEQDTTVLRVPYDLIVPVKPEDIGGLNVAVFLKKRENVCFQRSLLSFPNTQKKRNMKKPWSVLNSAKRNWNTRDASEMVSAPNSHVKPRRAVKPAALIRRRTPLFCCNCCRFFETRVCFMRTYRTITNMMQLNNRMVITGARNATKNTIVFPMKQLSVEIDQILCQWQLYYVINL